jgi:hypothetical protein
VDLAVADGVAEQEADDNPRHEVQLCCRRNQGDAIEDDLKLRHLRKDISNFLQETCGNNTGHKENHEVVVELIVWKDMLRPNYTPPREHQQRTQDVDTNSDLE